MVSAVPTSSSSVTASSHAIEPWQQAELVRCSVSFAHFLQYWQFKNRETGAISSFAGVWKGQARLIEAMEHHPRLFILKAGKLGFSELECAYDGWVARFRQPNARIHLLSRNLTAARELLDWVKFGLTHLPDWMQLPILENEAGADNSTSLKLYAGSDDVRTIVSYPATPNVAIDQTAIHTHLDEFARMATGGEAIWQSVETTIAPPPHGSMHIVTRGAGPNFAGRLWRQAMARTADIEPFFAAFDERPGRGEGWYEREANTLTAWGVQQFAPRTWQEAIQGDATYVYPMFDNPPGRHVVYADPCPLHQCERVAIGIDPGGVDPTALVLIGQRSGGRLHQYDERYGQHMPDDDIEAQIVEWWKLNNKRPMAVFSAPDQGTLLATLQSHFRTTNVNVYPANNERNEGIRLVTMRLNGDATGIPGLTVHERCEETIIEYQDYRVKSVTDAETKVVYAGERAIRHHADCMDATRYAIMGHGQWRDAPVVTLAGGLRIRGR